VALAFPLVVSGNALERLKTLFGDNNATNIDLREEARSSKELRRYLLEQSLLYTVQHPLVGVGTGQFSIYVGKMAQLEGKRGAWNETHNTLTEVSSECGIPALIFFVLGIVFATGSVYSFYTRARKQGNAEVARAGFCFLLTMASYLASIAFLANAYRFYLPLLIGVAIAAVSAARAELEKIPAAAPSYPYPGPGGFVRAGVPAVLARS
jgi:O-antigen ligase